ncbi:MAG: 30S ribosomal protein S2 [Flavicella sp.]|nr:30S ribosomal protein S2 [Flavicella sp.]
MANIEIKDLLDAGVHFGHLTRKWNPNMAPYIYTERNGVHIIDLYKTVAKIEESAVALEKIAASGRKILFVATKKQAKDIVADKAAAVNMPYITERWPGGMLTNFITIRKAVKKMAQIDRMKTDGSFNALSKREQLQINRQRAKLEKNLGSISDMTRLPGALFVIDVKKEHIAVSEAQKLNIPVFALVDTNSDPTAVDFVIPANDDASKSIDKVMGYLTDAVAEGLSNRKANKEKAEAPKEAVAAETSKEAPKEEVKAETAVEAPKEEAVAEKPKAAKAKKAPKAKKAAVAKEEVKAEAAVEAAPVEASKTSEEK